GAATACRPLWGPVLSRPMFGAFPSVVARPCVTFVSRASYELGVPAQLGLRRMIEPVRGCRTVTKRHMVRNDRTPKIEVDPDTYQVRVDGELATIPPAERLSLAQLHFLV